MTLKPDWDEVNKCMLIDDGLAGVANQAVSYESHDQFTPSPTKRVVHIRTVGKVRASLVSLLLTLQSLYRTGSRGSIPAMLNETYQPLALRLPSSSNLYQAYLWSAQDPQVGSGLFLATGTYDLYVCCIPSCHSP